MENGANPARGHWEAIGLQLIDASLCAHDPGLAAQLSEQAKDLFGARACLTILELGDTGQMPQPGTAGFSQLIDMAAVGDVEIVTAVLIRNHQWLPARGGRCEWVADDNPAREGPGRAAPAGPPPAPVSLKDELTAMGLLGNTPPPSAADAAVPSPRPVTPAGGPIPWEPPGQRQAPGGEEPKLAVEIIPTSLHGQDPRTHFGREWWDAARKAAYAAAGYRCEICGGHGPRHPVELHERYSYDEHARPPVQRITGLIVLCPACHAVKHLYRTSAVADENNNPAILDDALRHLREVNGWTEQQLQRYLKQVRRDYERREALGPWTADYSALSL